MIQVKKLCVSAIAVCGVAPIAGAGLVGHWTFDDADVSGSTLADSSGGGASGAIGANVTTGVAGIAGQAFSLPAGAAQDDVVDMGNATSVSSAVNASGELTMSGWVNFNTVGAAGPNRSIVYFLGDDTSNFSYIDIGVTDGAINPVGGAYGRKRSGGDSEVLGSSGLGDGQWHHIALVLDINTGTHDFYVDGTLLGSTTTSGSFPTLNNLEVGRLGRASPVDGYTGLVDDLQIYDEALSASDISVLFNNPGSVVPEPASLALMGLGGLSMMCRRRN